MRTLALAALAALMPVAAMAEAPMLSVSDAYARSANPKSAAAFMTIANSGPDDCTLIAAGGTVAERIELHTHQHADGVMKMVRDEDGFVIPAGGRHLLDRGGDHVMMLGLTEPLSDGQMVPLTLDFGDCGTVNVEVPVGNARPPEHGAAAAGADPNAMDHGAMDHGAMDHGAMDSDGTHAPAN